jgi:hypothetical protein
VTFNAQSRDREVFTTGILGIYTKDQAADVAGSPSPQDQERNLGFIYTRQRFNEEGLGDPMKVAAAEMSAAGREAWDLLSRSAMRIGE